MLGLCHGKVKNAYKEKKTPLSTVDHNTIHLIRAYHTKLQREGVVKKLVKVWDNNARETLKGFFDCIDWEMLTQGGSLEQVTDVVTHYITF